MPISRVLYLFPHQIRDDLRRVHDGESPTERLYGFVELERRHWPVAFSDGRFQGAFGRLLKFFRNHGLHLVDPGTLRELKRAQIVVVKDDFSLMISIACRIFRTRLIYLDSMFVLPVRWWQRRAAVLSILLADQVVGYSKSQAERWGKDLEIPAEKFSVLPYTLDAEFYESNSCTAGSDEGGYVLAVGRDMGRDYRTLIEAVRVAGLKLKLVTLPYLLKGIEFEHPDIEILQHLSYQELFSLYEGAAAVVIPLKADIDYPSGIRAMLEAMILGKPVVVTRTPALVEYVEGGKDVIFVEPGDVGGLRAALLEVMRDPEASARMARRGREKVVSMYGMDRFVTDFEAILRRVVTTSP